MSLSGKQIGWIVAGLVVIGISYYVGFVGWTDTQWTNGPQGYGLYEVTTTYPIAGVVGILGGLGLMGNAIGDDESESTDEFEQSDEDPHPGGTTQSSQAGVQDQTPSDKPSYCTNCGATIGPDAGFCTECGQSIQPADGPGGS